jgi:hypothetical protein
MLCTIQIWVCIFKYLPLDDLKTCKLVCQRWNKCDPIKIRGTYVFRSPIFFEDEVNYILSNRIKGTRLSIQFVGIDLDELDFAAFGHRVTELRITNCRTKNIERVRAMFIHTPNMKYLKFSVVDRYFHAPISWFAFNEKPVLEHVFPLLKQQGFCNVNLETLVYRLRYPINELCKIFTHLKSIRSLDSFRLYGTQILLWCAGSSVEELMYLDVCYHRLKIQLQSSPLPLPKFVLHSSASPLYLHLPNLYKN